MGYLLKEALKTLCGVNQWSYAVFWKIGCQNPKLLIWEECYYESALCSGLPGNENPETSFQDYNASWVSAETRDLQSNVQGGDKVHFLVNKMMLDNHVNIVGEGLVGRVAFTGNHQWILSENYFKEAHPPEVLKEVCLQFSAGMQTVAVIPVLPHGVVQFGSFLTIMENMGFVNDVTSLVLQLGYASGVFLSENYAANENAPRIGVPICLGNSTPSGSFNGFNYLGNSCSTSMADDQTSFSLAQEIQNELQPSNSNLSNRRSENYHYGMAKAEVIPANSEIWMNQHVSNSSSTLRRSSGQKMLSDIGRFSTPNMSTGILMAAQRTNSVSDAKRAANGNVISKHPASNELKNVNFPKMEASESDSIGHLTSNSLFSYSSASKHHMDNEHDIPLSEYNDHLNMAEIVPGFHEDDRKQKFEGQITKHDDAYVKPESGDDLFDVLGADFKNKLFSSCWNSCLSNDSAPNMHNWDNNNLPSKKDPASSEICSTSQGNSDSGIFSSTGTDHLLEAVVSNIQLSAKPIIDDNISCRTTLTNMSSLSAQNTSLPYGRFGISDQMKRELLGVPKYPAKAGTMSSSKEESRTYSHGSSIYGSQISSWIEKDQKAKQSNSVSTGYSKKPDEPSKTNRKRLKPGENPRPRPKDRQMIQDRVKELREIVPNGAKCSIDALLERTIKHMLFLQSVTKHADKLKQTGESKIISKDGGLLLKDNFEGGATWAYEVGSQSMVCPIIVEDLNQPRQMLVEMLCEERGLFLEIADIIRGLGLTILKGVMETRNDKIWARFAVEANRDVTRMEIFISLVRLLDQSAKNNAVQPHGITSENMMAQQFHQAASIPVTGRSRQ